MNASSLHETTENMKISTLGLAKYCNMFVQSAPIFGAGAFMYVAHF